MIKKSQKSILQAFLASLMICSTLGLSSCTTSSNEAEEPASGSVNAPAPRASAGEEPQMSPTSTRTATVTEPNVITLTGILRHEGLRGRGKSMSTWSGFDVGELVYTFTPDADQNLPKGLQKDTKLRAPKALKLEAKTDFRVRVTGVWSRASPSRPIEEVEGAAMRQMPISNGEGKTYIVGRWAVFTASDVILLK